MKGGKSMTRQTQNTSTVARARAYAKRIRTAQEAGIDVTNQGTMVDVTAPVIDIPVAPVSEINMDLTAPGIVPTLPDAGSTVPMDVVARVRRARIAKQFANAKASNRRRFAQVEQTVDVEAPVVDVPVAPVSEVVLAPAAPITDGGLPVQDSAVAPEYIARAKFATAYKLAELRKSLGIEKSSADIHQVAHNIANTMSIREMKAMARGLAEVKSASVVQAPKNAPVRSANRVSIGKVSSKTSTPDYVESLFL